MSWCRHDEYGYFKFRLESVTSKILIKVILFSCVASPFHPWSWFTIYMKYNINVEINTLRLSPVNLFLIWKVLYNGVIMFMNTRQPCVLPSMPNFPWKLENFNNTSSIFQQLEASKYRKLFHFCVKIFSFHSCREEI